MLDAAAGEATAAALLDAGPFDAFAEDPRRRRLAATRRPTGSGHAHAGHDHDHGLARDQDAHDVNRHDAAIRAFSVATDRPIPMAALDMFLTLLPSAHGAKLLRMKGLVKVAEDPGRPVRASTACSMCSIRL